VAPNKACYIPLAHGGTDLFSDAPQMVPMDIAMEKLAGLLRDPSVLKVGHNIKYDLNVLVRHIKPSPLQGGAATGPSPRGSAAQHRLGEGAVSGSNPDSPLSPAISPEGDEGSIQPIDDTMVLSFELTQASAITAWMSWRVIISATPPLPSRMCAAPARTN
jgi:hypothetical protein